jgi:hypothetical protein
MGVIPAYSGAFGQSKSGFIVFCLLIIGARQFMVCLQEWWKGAFKAKSVKKLSGLLQ